MSVFYERPQKRLRELRFLPPCITVFGSARTPENDPHYRLKVELSKKLAQKNFTVVTGGGQGIMEAAN